MSLVRNCKFQFFFSSRKFALYRKCNVEVVGETRSPFDSVDVRRRAEEMNKTRTRIHITSNSSTRNGVCIVNLLSLWTLNGFVESGFEKWWLAMWLSVWLITIIKSRSRVSFSKCVRWFVCVLYTLFVLYRFHPFWNQLVLLLFTLFSFFVCVHMTRGRFHTHKTLTQYPYKRFQMNMNILCDKCTQTDTHCANTMAKIRIVLILELTGEWKRNSEIYVWMSCFMLFKPQ